MATTTTTTRKEPTITNNKYTTYKDVELVSELRSRGRAAIIDQDGRVMRAEAIRILLELDAEAITNTRKVRVIFHDSSNPSAGPYVFASINDRNFQAPYEKEVVVPEYMLRECIDRAVTTMHVQEEDELGIRRTVRKRIPTYPYTLLGYIEDEAQDNN
jgi:hypothetical protein